MQYDWQVLTAVTLFILTYSIIVSEKIHKTTAALFGASLLIILGVVSQEEAVGFIDFNTIGLLMGMMILVSITRQTGLFEYLAIWQVRKSKGKPAGILVSLALLTGILSAFLDNVTTIIVIVPLTLSICKILGVNPIPFVTTQIFASNIGGTATLIGDPPNIMIGSATHLNFIDFIYNLAPLCFVLLIIVVFIFRIVFQKELKAAGAAQRLLKLDEKKVITDRKLLRKCLIVLGLVVCTLFLHGVLNLETATIAVSGASILLIISGVETAKILKAIEWRTIFFFIGLFILVGGLEKVGILNYIAALTFNVSGGDLLLTGIAILWLAAILSCFVDNIPFVAAMIPMLNTFCELSGTGNIDYLWWCLALGACFGGNGTIIGASANVVGTEILKSRGKSVTFFEYSRLAFPLMIFTVIAATIYAVIFLY